MVTIYSLDVLLFLFGTSLLLFVPLSSEGELSHVQLFVTPWSVARQPPLPMEFSRQECWSGLLFLLQGIFLTQGLSPCLLCLLH